jgi:diacylglycerol O-acyltransferase / wax synthase
MVVPLPIGVSDPVLRLRLVAKETVKRKARSRPSLGVVPHRGIAGRASLKIVDRQRVNLTRAAIPGPAVPQYFARARLVEVFPMAPLIGKVSLAVAAMSYAGQFNITVIADRDTYPDLDIFVAGVREELQALAAAMSAEPIPAPGFP